MPVSLRIETGSGNDSSANSYITLQECSDYHEEMGNSEWEAAASSPEKNRLTAIIRACRAIDRLYGKLFSGSPKNYGTQALEWPRTGVVVKLDVFSSGLLEAGISASSGHVISDSIIPPEVKKACFEAALIELRSPGDMTPDLDRGGKISSVTAGEVSVDFEKGASPLTVRTAIEAILFPFFRQSSVEVELG